VCLSLKPARRLYSPSQRSPATSEGVKGVCRGFTCGSATGIGCLMSTVPIHAVAPELDASYLAHT
jgi:hypothetical protein